MPEPNSKTKTQGVCRIAVVGDYNENFRPHAATNDALGHASGELGIKDAEHAEYDPYASKLVVNPLSCSLAGQMLEIELVDTSAITYKAFDTDRIKEKYYCNFGLNPAYQEQLHVNGFKVTGKDGTNEARILELDNHPFFIATLFVPQDNSTAEKPHKLVTAFLRSVTDSCGRE